MKKIRLLLLSVATLAIASCSSMQNIASSNSAASLSGQQCATATKSLYNKYKSTGKIDLTQSDNVMNVLAVATAYNQLKANKGDSSYRKAFAQGAIGAGTGLITAANAERFTSALLNSTGLSGLNSSNIQSKVQTASTIISLLNTLKQ